MRQLRIAMFSDNFYPEITGISDSIVTTGTELVSRGHTIAYIAPQYAKKDYEKAERLGGHDKERLNLFSIHHLPAFRLPGSPTGQGRIVIPFGFSLPFIRRFKPDVIHTHSPFGAGLEAMLAARIFRIPLVGTNHTPIQTFMDYSPWRGSIATAAAQRFYTWYYNRCLFMSAPCTQLIDDMRQHHFVKPAEAVPNPVSLSRFTELNPAEKEKLKKSRNLPGPVLLYSGRLAPEKHVDTIIRSLPRLIAEFPTVRLITTGHGVAEKSLRALAEKLNVAPYIIWSGFVDTQTLIQLYQVTDIFVIPSVAETQSLALMQAYATGSPAIGADAWGLKEYIPSECGFRIRCDDHESLANYIRLFLKDEPKRQRMGIAARAFVQRMSPENIAERWEHIYERVIREHQSHV